MILSIPKRLADGIGNIPAAADWMDDYDWLTALANGLAYVANGGMENWSGGTSFTNPSNGALLADNWTLIKSGTTPATADVTRDGSTIDSGQYSMKIHVTGNGSNDSLWAIKQSLPNPASFGGLTVVFGARVFMQSGSNLRLKIFDGSTTAFSAYDAVGGSWQTLQVKLTCQAVPTELTVTIADDPSNSVDTLYFDSIYLYVVPAAISARAQAALSYSQVPGSSGAATFPTDITVTTAGKGLVVTTPDGAHTYRIAVSNAGVITTEPLT